MRVRKPLTVGVRCAVEDPAGKILLVRHTYLKGWYLPGGGVEKGETLEGAILRELGEEVGVTATGRPKLFHAYSSFREYKSDHILLYRLTAFTMTPVKSPEIAEWGFFDPASPPEGTSPATARRLDELRGAADPGESW